MQHSPRNRVLIAIVLPLLLAFVPGSAWPAPEKPTPTVLSGVPWTPPSTVRPKVIYGTDDRIDLYQETDPERRAWAASTCGLLSSSDVREESDGTYSIETSSYIVCADEPFATQPTAATCTGFMVGTDIIATAGHCFDSGDLNSVRFVFGFVMEDADTPVLSVGADQVYVGVELLGRALSGGLDYAVVRVDRPITSPGAQPFPLRREGTIEVGEPVGVIGHPSGLPLKLAFGPTTEVRSSDQSGYFVANLDTYGGNSGSPVIHPETGVLEGILVRGETDFVTVGGCRRSNVISDSGGNGEDVSKSTTFMQFVPVLGSTLALDRDAYACGGVLTITLSDPDLAGTDSIVLMVSTSHGDGEMVTLSAVTADGQFSGSIELGDGEVTVENGQLEVAPGVVLEVTYEDMLHDVGQPDVLTDTALLDCVAPTVDGLALVQADARVAAVSFFTDEPASGVVRFGTECGTLADQASFTAGTSHNVSLQGLLPDTTYYWYVEAMDAAGNLSIGDDNGTCFSFTTTEATIYHTESFGSAPPDLESMSLRFTPLDGGANYVACQQTVSALPHDIAGATSIALGDDDGVALNLSGGAEIPFFGIAYSTVYVNSNGNITFTSNDLSYLPELPTHFQAPRVSALFTDLNPSTEGAVYYEQFSDRLVITWLAVPHYALGGANTVQVELFFNGEIRIAYENATAYPAIVGLSAGLGLQSGYGPSDLSVSAACDGALPAYHSADVDENYVIDVQELMRAIQFLNVGGYHCDALGEDGYRAGAGDDSCEPHNSDYNPQDWKISLTEILRLVQFYNAGGYSESQGSEDGFQAVLK